MTQHRGEREARGRPRKERFNIFLPPQQLDRLNALSQSTNLAIAEHIRRAIDGYLLHQEAQGNLAKRPVVA